MYAQLTAALIGRANRAAPVVCGGATRRVSTPEARGGVDDAIVFDAADQALQLLPRA